MKKCSFCAEEIQEEAIKCKHCGEFLNGSDRSFLAGKKIRWCFRQSFIILAVCCVGPLALPLIWWRPQTKQAWKIGLTAVILVLSGLLFQATLKFIDLLKEYYRLIETL